jgi:hypothetical protein
VTELAIMAAQMLLLVAFMAVTVFAIMYFILQGRA